MRLSTMNDRFPLGLTTSVKRAAEGSVPPSRAEPLYSEELKRGYAQPGENATDMTARLIHEIEAYHRYVQTLCQAVDAAIDFAGTVAGGAAWWDDVWADHAAAIDRARDRCSAGPTTPAGQQPLTMSPITEGSRWLFWSLAVLEGADRNEPVRYASRIDGALLAF